MAKGLFESPKKALLFVGMTMFSVAMLVGTEEDQGALVQAAASIEDPQPDYARDIDTFAPPPVRREQPRDDHTMMAFTPDEELVDTAEGFDPTPPPIEPYEPEIDLGAGTAQIMQIDIGDSAYTQY